MKLKDIIITEKATVQEAASRLENVRCRVVYVTRRGKILASISDGDIRRYLLKNESTSAPVKAVFHLNPTTLKEGQEQVARERFKRTEIYSIPVVNNNNEIVAVIFRDGKVVRSDAKIDLPLVMMAGGLGTRLFPYTKILPKALIPLGETPVSEYIINRFCQFGCKDVYLILNHKGNMIRAYFDGIEHDSYSVKYYEEDEPLGTAGGLSLLKEAGIDGDFILTNCDIIVDADYEQAYRYHVNHCNFITIIAAEYTSRVPYGVLKKEKNGNYLGVREKPEKKYTINTGIYIVNSRVIQEMSGKRTDFPDLIEAYHKTGENIGCYVVSENAYMDMGQLEEMEKTKEKLNLQ
ncbi:MAG: NTP transferase domain-containing protein [Lachnospiraceae bacterium]|nr:NTP transferase domain-containing protein [Lachnospiraceae bacterium]